MLEQNGGTTVGSRIVLVTAGQETVAPWERDVQPDLIRKGITVDSILITANASNAVISLAANTG